MTTITVHSNREAVEDLQQRLCIAGYLADDAVSGTFDDATRAALTAFCRASNLPETDVVDDTVWAALVDASFSLGDRSLFLRMPYFHGRDVLQLQRALGALGFTSGHFDGIFGAQTEFALRKFQVNVGIPDDGIAGSLTYSAIQRLHHSWEGKEAVPVPVNLGFARAADVLERNALCLFGTQDFTRQVAARISNLSLATNPSSKILSADQLLVAPDGGMLLVHIVLPDEVSAVNVPRAVYDDAAVFTARVETALTASRGTRPPRIAIELPGPAWQEAGVERSAQHFAITVLDALCAALSALNTEEKD